MKTLLHNWPIRSLVIVAATIVICVMMLPLAITDWAEGVRMSIVSISAEAKTESPPPSGPVIYVMSTIKATVLIGVPMLITLGISRLISSFRSAST